MSCSAAGTNGCLDLRRRATALGGRVSAEWSRCPGSMAQRPRDSVAPLQRSSGDWMPARIGRLSAGVGCRHPVTIRKVSLMVGSTRQAFVVEVDFQLTLRFLVVEMEDCRHRFRGAELQLPSLEVFT